ncbi:MAG: glycosyltransferase family 4 protein [Microthrixaceae bacterium]
MHDAVALHRVATDRYTTARSRPVRLVLCGQEVDPLGVHDPGRVVVTGFVTEDEKWAAIRGAVALLQPSRQESFGMTLAEAWLADRPVLVRSDCDVTSGLVERAGGGLTYHDPATFAESLDWLLEHPDAAARLAASGRAYVEAELEWDAVMARYEALLTTASTASVVGAGSRIGAGRGVTQGRRPTTA